MGKEAFMSNNFEARHMIEALRSGVPSRAIGRYFAESRGEIMQYIIHDLDAVRDGDSSKGRIISGKYGEGKTHLLNTVFNLAHANNMVVSFVSLSKETPFDKLYHVYKKVMNNTYLPGRMQPGFMHEFDQLTPNNQLSNELMLFGAKQLETDRLYYVLRAFLNTDDQDEKYLLQTDLEGDFVSNMQIKQIYKRIFQEKVTFSVNFVKSRHYFDYFAFLSHLFVKLGYKGWVLLFDETELTGRLGRKTRLKAYANMARFLFPSKQLASTYSLFAISASYHEDVVEGKHEYESLGEVYSEEDAKPIEQVLDAISKSVQLTPLSKSEVSTVLRQLVYLHTQAYGWKTEVDMDTLVNAADSAGHLLRTKIRAAIEYLDQLHQYGDMGKSSITSLFEGSFDEDEQVSLDEMLETVPDR